MIRLFLIFFIMFIAGGLYFSYIAEPCEEHWKICPPDKGGDYECPISHPETLGGVNR